MRGAGGDRGPGAGGVPELCQGWAQRALGKRRAAPPPPSPPQPTPGRSKGCSRQRGRWQHHERARRSAEVSAGVKPWTARPELTGCARVRACTVCAVCSRFIVRCSRASRATSMGSVACWVWDVEPVNRHCVCLHRELRSRIWRSFFNMRNITRLRPARPPARMPCALRARTPVRGKTREHKGVMRRPSSHDAGRRDRAAEGSCGGALADWRVSAWLFAMCIPQFHSPRRLGGSQTHGLAPLTKTCAATPSLPLARKKASRTICGSVPAPPPAVSITPRSRDSTCSAVTGARRSSA